MVVTSMIKKYYIYDSDSAEIHNLRSNHKHFELSADDQDLLLLSGVLRYAYCIIMDDATIQLETVIAEV